MSIVIVPKPRPLICITRKYVLQLAAQLQIPVVQRCIPLTELDRFQAAFICGTSPRVLPVNGIDAFRFDTQNGLLRRLMEAYSEALETYIRQHLVV